MSFATSSQQEPAVIALDFKTIAPAEAPPSLLLEKDTGRFAPPQAHVQTVSGYQNQCAYTLSYHPSTTGVQELEFMVEVVQPDSFTLSIDGLPLEQKRNLTCSHYPNLNLTEGEHTLTLTATQPFTLLKWRAQPIWEVLSSDQWSIIGPFPSAYRLPGLEADVKDALGMPFPPETEFNPVATYAGTAGEIVHWQKDQRPLPTIDFGRISNSKENGVFYARTVLHSDINRTAAILIGCDWWANLYLNGQRVKSTRPPEEVETDGAWFSRWKPLSANIHLNAGENVLLVKCHQGRAGNWFCLYINPADTGNGGQD
jgi:hypothetical protein